jgi:hypothetical protein
MSWREPRSVTSARSSCHSEEVCFCRFDSENADAVEEVNERARVPFARVTLGVLISPVDTATRDDEARPKLPG